MVSTLVPRAGRGADPFFVQEATGPSEEGCGEVDVGGENVSPSPSDLGFLTVFLMRRVCSVFKVSEKICLHCRDLIPTDLAVGEPLLRPRRKVCLCPYVPGVVACSGEGLL